MLGHDNVKKASEERIYEQSAHTLSKTRVFDSCRYNSKGVQHPNISLPETANKSLIRLDGTKYPQPFNERTSGAKSDLVQRVQLLYLQSSWLRTLHASS